MNEITQYIQKLEERYKEVQNERTWYDSCEYRREGRESELEDVISELKEVVAAFKARITERFERIDSSYDASEYCDWDAGAAFAESKALKKIVNEL